MRLQARSTAPGTRLIVLLAGLFASLATFAAPLPWEAPEKHLGAATCAGSNCHGATRPFKDAIVMQDEYFVWQRKDAHANAYKLLLGADGKRIARNMGIGPAHKAKECLVCHADYVPKSKQGKRYSVADGVSCETCHGGAEQYLGPHVSGNSHQDNLNQGLYPTEDPQARAELCLSCHYGSEDKPIDHRIMGAGHPPLSFELDTFTAIQPAHFLVDADYRKRKVAYGSAEIWAMGQAVASRFIADGVSGPRFKQVGLFPELVFFDCDACHHTVDKQRWQPELAAGIGPGKVRLLQSYPSMVGHILSVLDPGLAGQWEATLRELHQASQQSMAATQSAASKMKALNQAVIKRLKGHRFTPAEMHALVARITDGALGKHAGDYATAEQSTMALAALVVSLENSGKLAGAEAKRVNKALDALFDGLQQRATFDAARYRAALQAWKKEMPRG